MNKKDCRIVFLGTPDISASLLEAMIDDGYNIVGVITQPDAPRKRGGKDEPSPVGKVSLSHGIPLHRPFKLNKDYSILDEWNPDLLVTYAYGQILSTKVLGYSKLVPLNVHASLLPKLRGASPIQSCILEGDEKTGVCLMEMVKEMDAGRIFAQCVIDIPPSMVYTELEATISKAAIDLVLSKLPMFLDGQLTGVPQDNENATFCHFISREDMELKLSLSPREFVNRVRAFSMKPGAFITLENGECLKVLKAQISDKSIEKGTIKAVSKKELVLGLENGAVSLTVLQRAGKKPCDASAFINGFGVGNVMIVKL